MTVILHYSLSNLTSCFWIFSSFNAFLSFRIHSLFSFDSDTLFLCYYYNFICIYYLNIKEVKTTFLSLLSFFPSLRYFQCFLPAYLPKLFYSVYPITYELLSLSNQPQYFGIFTSSPNSFPTKNTRQKITIYLPIFSFLFRFQIISFVISHITDDLWTLIFFSYFPSSSNLFLLYVYRVLFFLFSIREVLSICFIPFQWVRRRPPEILKLFLSEKIKQTI